MARRQEGARRESGDEVRDSIKVIVASNVPKLSPRTAAPPGSSARPPTATPRKPGLSGAQIRGQPVQEAERLAAGSLHAGSATAGAPASAGARAHADADAAAREEPLALRWTRVLGVCSLSGPLSRAGGPGPDAYALPAEARLRLTQTPGWPVFPGCGRAGPSLPRRRRLGGARSRGVRGSVGEIGIHLGLSFAVLTSTAAADEPLFACDGTAVRGRPRPAAPRPGGLEGRAAGRGGPGGRHKNVDGSGDSGQSRA
eukprot:tig00000658_g2928.t1